MKTNHSAMQNSQTRPFPATKTQRRATVKSTTAAVPTAKTGNKMQIRRRINKLKQSLQKSNWAIKCGCLVDRSQTKTRGKA